MKHSLNWLLLAVSATLVACGGSGGGSNANTNTNTNNGDGVIVDTSTTRGTLVQSPPPRVQSLDTLALGTAIGKFGSFGNELISLAGSLKCGVDIHHVEYATVGAADEPTRSSAALMVPTGSNPACSGPHPVLLYGHGSSIFKQVDMGDLRPSANYGMTSSSIAALFAAQGYIVIAPNYSGYDSSTLPYHPHHIADQNAKDMIDALSASRKALPRLATPVTENGKLFLSGYSEGGFATMATHRAMQAAGIAVTASAPLSGNYAESYGFELALSRPALFADGLPPSADGVMGMVMQITAWQKAYGNLYASPSEAYASAYASGAETLVPTSSTLAALVNNGKLPVYLLANDMPNVGTLDAAHQAYYGPPEKSLLKSSYMTGLINDVTALPCPATSSVNPLACATTHPVRKAWFKNDLRTWTPNTPMLMCGGHGDQEVFFDNAELTYAYFQAHGVAAGLVTKLDVDSAATVGDPYALAKATFSGARQMLISQGQDPNSVDNYHGFTAFAGCHVAARDFFAKF